METTPSGASVSVLPDADALALAAADVILEEARRAVLERGRFTIALAGGSTPKPVYRLLAAPPFAQSMPWAQTEVFWGDERCVAVDDARSNERMAREALLDHVPVSAERVHPMRCGGGGAAPAGAARAAGASVGPAWEGSAPSGEAAAQRAARDYEAALRSVLGEGGGMDLVLLGLGDNAHTASLFPGSEALDERDRWVAAALEDPGTAAATGGAGGRGTGERLWRVTLTAPFINRSGMVLFVVSGATKAPAARSVLRGEGDPRELPALLIRPTPGRLLWLLDEAAAS
jgi:6-phosphogluconolactonase